MRRYVLTARNANVIVATSPDDAEMLHGPNCADVLLHDCALSAKHLRYFAPLAIHWPRAARQGGDALQSIMPRLLESLNTTTWHRRRKQA